MGTPWPRFSRKPVFRDTEKIGEKLKRQVAAAWGLLLL
jgi:hypothetical protein